MGPGLGEAILDGGEVVMPRMGEVRPFGADQTS